MRFENRTNSPVVIEGSPRLHIPAMGRLDVALSDAEKRAILDGPYGGIFGPDGLIPTKFESFALAGLGDRPAMTYGGGSPAFSDSMTFALKRLTNNASNVNVAGDTRFAYPGVPQDAIIPFSGDNSRTIAATLPGGVAQYRKWDYQIEFVTASKFVALRFVAGTTNFPLMLFVDGKPTSLVPYDGVFTQGANCWMMFEFPERRSRRVRVQFSGINQFTNFMMESANPPVRPERSPKVLALIGDSMSVAPTAASASTIGSWVQLAANMLGFDAACNAAIGGTKWVAGDVAISHFGGDRMPMALSIAPNALIFCGTRNDSGSPQSALDDITAAVVSALNAAAASVSRSRMFVIGTFTPLSQNAAVKAGAEAAGVKFIDATEVLRAEDLGGDGIHPNPEGAARVRERLIPKLFDAGCVAA